MATETARLSHSVWGLQETCDYAFRVAVCSQTLDGPETSSGVQMSWKKKRKWRNLHHLTPRSRNGNHTRANLLLIDEERHVEWHRVFGNRTLGEVINLLIRVERAKAKQVA